MGELEPSDFNKSYDDQAANAERDLCQCPECVNTLVYPTEWEEASESHWLISLRCPDCEHTETTEFSQEQAERFDEELDIGTEALVRDYKKLMAVNMQEELQRFVCALEVDAILPEDF